MYGTSGTIFGWMLSQLLSQIARYIPSQNFSRVFRQFSLGNERSSSVRTTRHGQSNPQSNPRSNSHSNSQSISQSNLVRTTRHVRLPGCPTMTTEQKEEEGKMYAKKSFVKGEVIQVPPPL